MEYSYSELVTIENALKKQVETMSLFNRMTSRGQIKISLLNKVKRQIKELKD